MKGLIVTIIIFTVLGCSTLDVPDRVRDVLDTAGDNRKELVKAIEYFQLKNDSLQLDALYFLISNMKDHSFYEITLKDSNDTEIPFNILDHDDYDTVISTLDSLEETAGKLTWKVREKYPDQENISSGLLIENIEESFQAWKEKSWARQYGYEVFRDFILPYRGSSEPLESWRSHFRERYSYLDSLLNGSTDPIEAAVVINRDLKTCFGFDPRFYCHPTDQGLSEMLETGLGRCEDMTNFTIYALRANGIAVTSDYTPYWADTGNNHAWNAVLTPDGIAIPFMGCEADPGDYQLRERIAKVYRKTFAEQEDNLAFKLQNDEKAPAWLSGKNYRDVTGQYVQIADVELILSEPVPDSVNFAYLAVFNSGKWKAINWSEIDSGRVLFRDMGVDLCYLPVYYINDDLIPAGPAFILDIAGDVILLEGDDRICPLALRSVTRKTIDESTENRQITFLETGKEYELFVWEKEWRSKGKKTAGKKPLIFCNVEGDRLYWLVGEGSRKDERIFTYEDGQQVWW